MEDETDVLERTEANIDVHTTELPASRSLVPISFTQKIESIQSSAKEWEQAFDKQGNIAIRLLGQIYEAIPEAKEHIDILIRELKTIPEVAESKSWDPFKEGRTTEDLYLTLCFGLKKRRSQKSQWKRALVAGAKAEVPRTADAFVKWISGKGGIEGVQSASESDSGGDKFASAIKALRELEAIGAPVEDVTGIVWLTGEFGISLFHRAEPAPEERVATQRMRFECCEDLIVNIHASIAKFHRDQEREIKAEVREAELTWVKLLWKEYKSAEKSRRTNNATFKEWVSETGEFDLADQKSEIIRSTQFSSIRLPAKYEKYTPKGRAVSRPMVSAARV